MTTSDEKTPRRYNFDEIVERNGTNCIKYDWRAKKGLSSDVIPLWVADMDFRTADEIIESLVKTARHGIFGYSDTDESYFTPIGEWFKRRFQATLKPEWLVKAPGVVYAINTAIRAYSEENDPVLIQSPVYHPFHSSVTVNKRRLVDNTLIYKDGKYTIDLNDFEDKIVKEKIGLFILCSPHNPVGRVWTREELTAMGEICLRHNCLVLADEIHQDFVWGGREHHVFTELDPRFQEIAVVMTAPSKTFNLAGLNTSNIFIPNESLRKKFTKEVERTGVSQLSIMGLNASIAAYSHGYEWFDQLKDYLEKSILYIESFFKNNLQELHLVKLEGTYLMWADFSRLNIKHEDLVKRLASDAKLWLSDGLGFGESGRDFQRINIAAPLKTVSSALERLAAFVKSL
ncbi:MAG: pyridoxal phosphate-dependent aminotransferase [Deltaproteobacteria bacterium]|jgi:cystathionine beta-lyase|nr:pyridoxal phosphate-dependent aminotransferase [Deltaproteobacteria bacterium]